MPETTDAPESHRVQKLVGNYVKIRDKIKALNDQHEQVLAPFVTLQNELTAALQTILETAGAQSIKTSDGTVYSSTRYTASLADPKAFMDFVIANAQWDLLDRKANATAVKDYVAEHKALPPGANLNALRTIGVRRASGS